MEGTNKPKEHTETELISFDTHGDLSQSEENKQMMWKGKYRSKDNTKKQKKEETLTKKMKRSLNERHTLTYGGLNKMFQQSQMSFSIRRE